MQNLNAAVFVAALGACILLFFWRVVLFLTVVFCLMLFLVGIASVLVVVIHARQGG